MCIEYYIQVNMYHVNAQGVDERTINVHYYYYKVQQMRVIRFCAKQTEQYILQQYGEMTAVNWNVQVKHFRR